MLGWALEVVIRFLRCSCELQPATNTRLPFSVPLFFVEEPGEAKETPRISKFKGKVNINFHVQSFFSKTAAVLLEKFTAVLLQMH